MTERKRDTIAQNLIERTKPFIPDLSDGAARPKERPWQKWLDAKLGLRGYWYPIEASRNLTEGTPKVLTPLGEEILLMRKNGKVYAVEDRCMHRGARFSVRPLCLTDDTITCWLHTFTFSLEDGTVRTVLNAPESKLVGRPGIKVYPVEEAKGLIFIFIGDTQPHPLAEDVPPGFLDDDVAVYVADVALDQANWRLGVEGSFDPAHHFIHNWSTLAIHRGIPLSFGFVGNLADLAASTQFFDQDGAPKGFVRKSGEGHMRFEADIPSADNGASTRFVLPMARAMSAEEIKALQQNTYQIDVGVYLPGTVTVSPWPSAGITTAETFTPCTEDTHYYVRYGWKRVKSEEEREEWETGGMGELLWKIPNVDGFTVDDTMAREGVARFYDEEDGFDREALMAPDIELLMWRLFASENARAGVQEEKHTQGRFRKKPV